MRVLLTAVLVIVGSSAVYLSVSGKAGGASLFQTPAVAPRAEEAQVVPPPPFRAADAGCWAVAIGAFLFAGLVFADRKSSRERKGPERPHGWGQALSLGLLLTLAASTLALGLALLAVQRADVQTAGGWFLIGAAETGVGLLLAAIFLRGARPRSARRTASIVLAALVLEAAALGSVCVLGAVHTP